MLGISHTDGRGLHQIVFCIENDKQKEFMSSSRLLIVQYWGPDALAFVTEKMSKISVPLVSFLLFISLVRRLHSVSS